MAENSVVSWNNRFTRSFHVVAKIFNNKVTKKLEFLLETMTEGTRTVTYACFHTSVIMCNVTAPNSQLFQVGLMAENFTSEANGHFMEWPEFSVTAWNDCILFFHFITTAVPILSIFCWQINVLVTTIQYDMAQKCRTYNQNRTEPNVKLIRQFWENCYAPGPVTYLMECAFTFTFASQEFPPCRWLYQSAWWPWPLIFRSLNRFMDYSYDGGFHPTNFMFHVTDKRTDGRTDRQTDRQTDRHRPSFHNAPPCGGRGII